MELLVLLMRWSSPVGSEIGPIVHVWFMATDYVWLGLACSKTIKRNHGVLAGSHQAIGSRSAVLPRLLP